MTDPAVDDAARFRTWLDEAPSAVLRALLTYIEQGDEAGWQTWIREAQKRPEDARWAKEHLAEWVRRRPA